MRDDVDAIGSEIVDDGPQVIAEVIQAIAARSPAAAVSARRSTAATRRPLRAQCAGDLAPRRVVTAHPVHEQGPACRRPRPSTAPPGRPVPASPHAASSLTSDRQSENGAHPEGMGAVSSAFTTRSLDDLGDAAGTNGAATLADREAQALVHGDRLDQLDQHLGVVARHDHLGALGRVTTPVTSVVRK